MKLHECIGLELLVSLAFLPYLILAILLLVVAHRIRGALYTTQPQRVLPDSLARELRDRSRGDFGDIPGGTTKTPEAAVQVLVRYNLVEASLRALRAEIHLLDGTCFSTQEKERLIVRYTILFLERAIMAPENSHLVDAFITLSGRLAQEPPGRGDKEEVQPMDCIELDVFQAYWDKKRVSFIATIYTPKMEAATPVSSRVP